MLPIKAALLHSPGNLSVEDSLRPLCPEAGAIIAVEACSLCSSDIKMWKVGHRDLAYPRILGHEVVGKVVETDTPGIDVGTRIQVWPGVACGVCPACLHGFDNQCDRIGIIGFNLDGGLAELMAVPRGCIERGGANPLPQGMGSDLATLTEPLACCINAQDSLRIGPDESVMVIGGGPLGSLHVLLAKEKGANEVILVESDEKRASLVEHSAKPDRLLKPGPRIVEGLMEANAGRGPDVIILATSEPPPISELLRGLAPRGRLSLFSGLPRDGSRSLVDLNQIHYLERAMVGSYGCRSSDCREALELLSTRKVDASWLITKRFPLSGTLEALQYVDNRQGMKATMIGKG